ncbi:MAG: hypothetical protein LVQ64_06290 [Thermoplasmatales archaeon]|nr:hypothetical protein [Thermoplasmatales archaeon]
MIPNPEERPGTLPIELDRTRMARALVGATVVLLGVEFLLGLAVSLWTTKLPANLSFLFGSSAFSYGYLSAHAIIGAVLVLVEIGLIVSVYRLHRPFLAVSAGSTFVLTIVAAAFGSAFLASGDNAIYAFLMALFFLGAWTSAILLQARLRFATRWTRYRARQPDPPASGPMGPVS